MRAPRSEAWPWTETDVVEAVLVTASRCHLCDDAKHLLNELEGDYPLTVREVELSSVEGLALSRRFSMPFPPLLLVDSVRFGHGRISRRQLVQLLDQRSGRRMSPVPPSLSTPPISVSTTLPAKPHAAAIRFGLQARPGRSDGSANFG